MARYKKHQGCSEPAENLARSVFMMFDQPFFSLIFCKAWRGGKKATPNACFPRPAAVIPRLHVGLALCSGLWWHSLTSFMASSGYSYGFAARHKFWRFQAWRFQSRAEPHGNDSQSCSYKNNYIARGKEWQEMSPKEISAAVTGSVPAL